MLPIKFLSVMDCCWRLINTKAIPTFHLTYSVIASSPISFSCTTPHPPSPHDFTTPLPIIGYMAVTAAVCSLLFRTVDDIIWLPQNAPSNMCVPAYISLYSHTLLCQRNYRLSDYLYLLTVFCLLKYNILN